MLYSISTPLHILTIERLTYCRVDFSTSTLRTGPFPKERVSGWFLLLLFIEFPVFNANSVDPDQTPRSVAPDLGLNCLPHP